VPLLTHQEMSLHHGVSESISEVDILRNMRLARQEQDYVLVEFYAM
jgi:hypothetical protein